MKTFTLATLGLIIITTSLTLAPFHSTEPSYRDKKLSAWLKQLDSLDREEWRQGVEAVRALGTNSLPTLARRLRAKDSVIRRRLIDLCDAYPVVVLIPAEAHYESALEACRVLGSSASPLLPEIIPFLADNRRTKAVKVLVAIGQDALERLKHA